MSITRATGLKLHWTFEQKGFHFFWRLKHGFIKEAIESLLIDNRHNVNVVSNVSGLSHLVCTFVIVLIINEPVT